MIFGAQFTDVRSLLIEYVIVASFVSNTSHLGSPPGRIPSGPTVLKGGSRWNLDTTRSIDSTLNDIFDPFPPSRDPIRRYLLSSESPAERTPSTRWKAPLLGV